MKYLLIHAVDPTRPDDTTGDVEGRLREWIDETVASGANRHGSRLANPVTVRVRDGELLVTDGPFAETKEQIAGYDVIECADLDSALEVVARHPTAHLGTIEIRPFWS